jgi:hypothetical protein
VLHRPAWGRSLRADLAADQSLDVRHRAEVVGVDLLLFHHDAELLFKIGDELHVAE